MQQIKDMYRYILKNGKVVNGRAGEELRCFKYHLHFNLKDGFPAVTSKKLQWQAVVGELLWFLSGSSKLKDLKHYTFGDEDSDKWTIWTDDYERWQSLEDNTYVYRGNLGYLYGTSWRNYNWAGVDQIKDIIEGIKVDPYSRRHIVEAWNPLAVADQWGALPPCHKGFQVVILDGKLNMSVQIRSNDAFLGNPYNVSSYALLAHMLALWTKYEVGELHFDITNPHIYTAHLDAVNEYLDNDTHKLPMLVLPEEVAGGLDETLKLTALDFEDSLLGYNHSGVIKAPLLVGA